MTNDTGRSDEGTIIEPNMPPIRPAVAAPTDIAQPPASATRPEHCPRCQCICDGCGYVVNSMACLASQHLPHKRGGVS